MVVMKKGEKKNEESKDSWKYEGKQGDRKTGSQEERNVELLQWWW